MVQEMFATTQEIVDVVVVGAGAAGLSAALFLTRARRRTIVYDGGPTRTSVIEHVHEFLGFEEITPAELQARGRAEVERYGGEIRNEVVSKIEPRPDGLFDVWSQQGIVTARAVVLATGLVDVLPPVPGLREGWGRDVHVCPCFSGYEVRDKRFVVFGLGERLAQLGSFLTAWTLNVTVVSRHEFNAAALDRLHDFGVELIRDEVTAFVRQDGQLVSLSTAGGKEVPTDAVFVATPLRPASDLPASLCEVNEAGFAIADADGKTSRPGVWVIGNASDPIGHLAHATAAGARVGPWVVTYLIEQAHAHKKA